MEAIVKKIPLCVQLDYFGSGKEWKQFNFKIYKGKIRFLTQNRHFPHDNLNI